jgi:predicted transcriptional regulator
MTSRTGSIGAFMQWTKDVVRDPAAHRDDAKHWTDGQASGGSSPVSVEALVKLLAPANLALLGLIGDGTPRSVGELARLTSRKESNLSRTLRRLSDAGLVVLEPGPRRTRVPRLAARRVTLDLDLTGAAAKVSVRQPVA